ncbi:MAG TPA: phage tail sheath subtilisin-like domain-containing protein [Gaiellaceae bacterium]|nr:phage tail sheath subtilisin-like domain-containing protein [Gaiellaceae bacterium]
MPVQTTYPGVYIEEVPSGVRTIVGVSTSVTAFAGAAGRGPIDEPVRIFSFTDYARAFGPPLDEARPLGHAVQHYFANGGSEAIIVRVGGAGADEALVTLKDVLSTGNDVLTLTAAGKGEWANWTGAVGLQVEVDREGSGNPLDLFNLTLRYLTVDPATNAPTLSAEESYVNLSMSPQHPRYALTVLGASQLAVPSLPGTLTSTTAGSSTGADALADPLTIEPGRKTLRVSVDFGPAVDLVLFPADTVPVDKGPVQIRNELNAVLANAGLLATASLSSNVITIESSSTGMNSSVVVTPAPSGDLSASLKLGRAYGGAEVSGSADRRPATTSGGAIGFAGGDDGSDVGPGEVVPSGGTTGIYALSSLLFPRFNLLCLPGLTSNDDVAVSNAIAYCKEERAFCIVDSPTGGYPSLPTSPPSLGSLTALGEHGAVYYPRLQVVETAPGGVRKTLDLPACGAVAGVFARTDSERGIWKAPAGREAGIVGISGLTQPTSDDLSGVLNPRGINVLRSFPGAGTVVWGARTLKGDDTASSEFKYVPIRRLTNYIESSLYLGTQFAVFEPNDPDLWAQLRLAAGTFMRGLFRQGAFQESAKRSESDSFFVKCDEENNPQSEIDLGRVNILVGFAPLKPAEFVIVSITQISQLEE